MRKNKNKKYNKLVHKTQPLILNLRSGLYSFSSSSMMDEWVHEQRRNIKTHTHAHAI